MEREETEEKESVRKTEKERHEMKYKVGDKVKVRSDLKNDVSYGSQCTVEEMMDHKGSVVTISEVGQTYYQIEGDEEGWSWTDEMFEGLVEEELTAEEAIRIQGEMCSSTACEDCEIGKLRYEPHCECVEFCSKNPKKVIEILKQYKKDHEKKPIETEIALYVQIIEVDTHILKHEEKVETDIKSMDAQKAEILKKYCSEHDGKYYAISERRCVVKE